MGTWARTWGSVVVFRSQEGSANEQVWKRLLQLMVAFSQLFTLRTDHVHIIFGNTQPCVLFKAVRNSPWLSGKCVSCTRSGLWLRPRPLLFIVSDFSRALFCAKQSQQLVCRVKTSCEGPSRDGYSLVRLCVTCSLVWLLLTCTSVPLVHILFWLLIMIYPFHWLFSCGRCWYIEGLIVRSTCTFNSSPSCQINEVG